MVRFRENGRKSCFDFVFLCYFVENKPLFAKQIIILLAALTGRVNRLQTVVLRLL